MVDTVRVALIDEHPALREGVTQYLKRTASDLRVIFSVAAAPEFLESGVAVDVVLLGPFVRSDDDGVESIPEIVAAGARVLVYTSEERVVPLRRAVEAGAAGVLLKRDPLAAVAPAIRDVIAGEFCCSGALAHALLNDGSVVPELSERQLQVLQALDEGLDYRATARVLGITEGVVKTHLSRIREKYRSHGVEPGNSHHLTRLAWDDGYLR